MCLPAAITVAMLRLWSYTYGFARVGMYMPTERQKSYDYSGDRQVFIKLV